MSLPTANELAQRLINLSRALDAGVKGLADADAKATQAKIDYEKARIRAVLAVGAELRGDKSYLAAEREAKVAERIEEQAFALIEADQDVRTAKESLKKIYADVDLVRSLNAGLRAEMSLSGMSGT